MALSSVCFFLQQHLQIITTSTMISSNPPTAAGTTIATGNPAIVAFAEEYEELDLIVEEDSC